MKIDIGIKGVDKVQLKLKLLETSVREKIKDAMAQGASIVVARAKEIITEKGHIITGNLRRSIQYKVGWSGINEIDGVVGTDVDYSIYVEALPDGGYLFPALREKGKEALGYVEKAVVEAVKEVS